MSIKFLNLIKHNCVCSSIKLLILINYDCVCSSIKFKLFWLCEFWVTWGSMCLELSQHTLNLILMALSQSGNDILNRVSSKHTFSCLLYYFYDQLCILLQIRNLNLWCTLWYYILNLFIRMLWTLNMNCTCSGVLCNVLTRKNNANFHFLHKP